MKLCLILLHSERPKLYEVLAFLSVIGLNISSLLPAYNSQQIHKPLVCFQRRDMESDWVLGPDVEHYHQFVANQHVHLSALAGKLFQSVISSKIT